MKTDQQVRRLKMLIQTEKTQAIVASKAAMDEKTARKYLKNGKLPSQCQKEHNWRTRQDPFEQEWEQIFKDPMVTAAAIDRLVHHSVILELNISSYRMEEAKGKKNSKKNR